MSIDCLFLEAGPCLLSLTSTALYWTTSTGVYFVDRLRRITYWNRGAERLTGYSATEAVGRRCRDGMLNHCDAAGTVLCDEGCPLLAAIQDGRQSEAHVFLQHKDGSRRPVCVRAAALRDDAGRIVGAFETFHDDSRLAAAEEQADEMRRLALLDPLTGLHNRRFGEMTLAGWLAQWTRYARRFGVLFADIDCFKTVNDEFGHDVGDEVFRMVANTLSHGARQGDVIVRWGGEEFVILVADARADDLRAVAERLHTLVARSRLTVQRRRLEVTVSIGATLVAPGDTADGIIRRADALLYQSKMMGRDRITVDCD